jgi:hypothetical protein
VLASVCTTAYKFTDRLLLDAAFCCSDVGSKPAEHWLLPSLRWKSALDIGLLVVSRVSTPVLVLVDRHLQLKLVDPIDATLLLNLLDVYLIALDHRYQNRMGLSQLGQLLAGLHVRLVEGVFPLQVLQHLLVPDAQILYFLPKGDDGLLHLAFLEVPVSGLL